jgi:hypothetical protein
MDNNILEYRPNLSPKRTINSALVKETQDIASAIFSPSASLQQLKDSLPYITLAKLGLAADAINQTLDRITGNIKDIVSDGVTFKEYAAAVDANDFETIDKFEDPIANDINGNFMAELYYPLKKMSDDIKDFTDFFKNVNYGSNVDIDKAASIDGTNYEKIYEKEMNGDTGNINYGALYVDTQVNQIVQLHTKNIGDSMKQVNSAIDAHENFTPDNIGSENKDGINKTIDVMFKSDVSMTSKDKVKLRQNLNSNAKATIVSKVFDVRQDFLTATNSIETVENMGDSAFKTKMVNSLKLLYNNVSDIVLDMYKTIQLESMYIQDYVSTVGDKQITRNSYSAYNGR